MASCITEDDKLLSEETSKETCIINK